jgi:hypothetical protein
MPPPGCRRRAVSRSSCSAFPRTDPVLFGHDAELARLAAAWGDGKTGVFALMAWGGVGKTALANKWLAEMVGAGYRGARRVYGHSFYSQEP